MAYTRVWSESYPSGSASANTIDTLIQEAKTDLRERLCTAFGLAGTADFDDDPFVVKNMSALTFTATTRLVSDVWRANSGAGNTTIENNAGTAIVTLDRASLAATFAGAVACQALTASGQVNVLAANILQFGSSGAPATGTIRLPNARTVGWRNAADSADYTFGLTASDLFQFTAQITAPPGTATTYYKPPLVLYMNQGLSRSAQTDGSLASYSLPANALSADGQQIRITICGHQTAGTGGANPDNGSLTNIKFGATAVGSFGGNPESAQLNEEFVMTIIITRTSATTQTAAAYLVGQIGGMTTTVRRTGPGETLSGAVTIDFRGTAGIPTSGTTTLFYDSILVEHLAS